MYLRSRVYEFERYYQAILFIFRERERRPRASARDRYSNFEQNSNTKKNMSFFTSKVTPAPQKKVQDKDEGRNDGNDKKAPEHVNEE